MEQVHGEILGWRAWNVVKIGRDKYRLGSLGTVAPHYGTLWTPGKMMEALCDRCDASRAQGAPLAACSSSLDGRAPGESCTCGFYAAATHDTFELMPYQRYGQNATYRTDGCNRDGQMVRRPKAARVIGRVAMAGKVIPGTQGWRAQLAWPVEIFVPYEHTALVDILHKTYNVPVRTDNWLNPIHGKETV